MKTQKIPHYLKSTPTDPHGGHAVWTDSTPHCLCKTSVLFKALLSPPLKESQAGPPETGSALCTVDSKGDPDPQRGAGGLCTRRGSGLRGAASGGHGCPGLVLAGQAPRAPQAGSRVHRRENPGEQGSQEEAGQTPKGPVLPGTDQASGSETVPHLLWKVSVWAEQQAAAWLLYGAQHTGLMLRKPRQ